MLLLAALPIMGQMPHPPASEPARASLVGTAMLPGDTLDHSGLDGEVMPGVAHARLGSLGSGLDTIDCFPGGAHLLAISDRGPADGAAPFQCRFHRLTLAVDPAKTPAVTVTCDATELLKRPDGRPFIGVSKELGTTPIAGGASVPNRLDPEAIRRLPSGNLLVSEEYGPLVLEFDPRGAFVREWPVPAAFRCAHPGVDEAAELPPHNSGGRQPNKGFEGLAVTPKGAAWALLQAPLLQDTAATAKGKRTGQHVRLLDLGDKPGAEPMRECVYRLESPKHGLCELLALDEHRFLTIERDGSDAKFRRVYLIDTEGASDVSGIASLADDALPEGVRAVTKRLVVDLCEPGLGLTAMPEKIEGLCFGPALPDGRRTLVVASDNDMKADQPTWFWVFTLPSWAEPQPETAPAVVVLGIAQDAGAPQAGRFDDTRWNDAGAARMVACLGIVDPRTGHRWMIDATPDFRRQLFDLRQASTGPDRPALDGIFLTHAHIGHYTGLMFLGHESMGAKGVPVWAMPRMANFLRSNGPWDQLVRYSNIDLRPLAAGVPVAIGDKLTVTPFTVPHRQEYAEVVGFRIEGPARSALYIPDIDAWEQLDAQGTRIEELVRSVDIAYLDGTFFANGEIPGRDMSGFPHPFIRHSLERFAALPASERAKIRFIHLNHTNPALDPASPARREIEAAGMRVAEQGEKLPL